MDVSPFPVPKNVLEAFRDWWGERPWMRRSNGNPTRTRASLILWSVAQEAGMHSLPDCALPELEALAERMANLQAGEFGWDTEKGLQGIRAAASIQQTVIQRETAQDER
jgi:hypothetical protein